MSSEVEKTDGRGGELALVWCSLVGFLDWFDGFFGLVVSLIFNDFVCFDTPKEVLTKTPTIEL